MGSKLLARQLDPLKPLTLIIALVPALAVGLYAYQAATRSITNMIDDGIYSDAQIGASQLASEIQAMIDLSLDSTARTSVKDAVLDRDSENLRRILQLLVTTYPDIGRSFVVDPQGYLWADFPKFDEVREQNFSHREWYRGVISTGRPYVSGLYERAASPVRSVLAIAAPIFDDKGKDLIGILAFQFFPDELSKQLNAGQSDGKSYVVVHDHHLAVVAHPDESHFGQFDSPYKDQLAASFEKSLQLIDPYRLRSVIGRSVSVTITGNSWTITALLDHEQAVAPLKHLRQQLGIVAVIIVVGNALVMYWLYLLYRERLVAEDRLHREEQLGKVKDQFLAKISHELRTPMTSIMGWLDVIRDTPGMSSKLCEIVDILKHSANLEKSLIEDLLDVSRISTGKLRLNKREVCITAIVSSAIDAITPIANQQKRTIKLEKLEPSLLIYGDEGRIGQIINNLLSNAIKFSNEGQQIDVSVGPENGHVKVKVRDRGMGIDPRFLTRVFDPFSQADSTLQRKTAGLGLGLSISKHLAELHGGTLAAHSDGLGKGAELVLRLPKAPSTVNSDAPEGAANVAVIESDKTLQGSTILLVDDAPEILRLLHHVLSSKGALVKTATSAAAGLEIIEREVPSVLISDIGMPEIDGYQFIKSLRQSANPQIAKVTGHRPHRPGPARGSATCHGSGVSILHHQARQSWATSRNRRHGHKECPVDRYIVLSFAVQGCNNVTQEINATCKSQARLAAVPMALRGEITSMNVRSQHQRTPAEASGTNKLWAIPSLLIVVTFGVIVALTLSPKVGDGDFKLVLRLSHVFGPNEELTQFMDLVAERIQTKTAGAIEILTFPQGQIATYKDGVEMVKRGAHFISVEDPSYIGDYQPEFTALVGPMLYRNFDEYVDLVETPMVAAWKTKLEQQGIKILSLQYIFGFRNLITNRVVRTPKDLAGVKLRTPGSQLFIQTINAMGATATPLPWGETFSALQQGVVDGLEGSEFTNLGTKVYETGKTNVALSNHFLGVCGVYISTEVWNKIPAQYQEIIASEFETGADEMIQQLKEKQAAVVRDLESHGVKFNEVDREAFEAQTKGVFDSMPGVTMEMYDQIAAELARIRSS